MHIPPYHRQSTWQRFFVGMLFGALIAYLVLLYMHGAMYERLMMENMEMEEIINDLRSQNKALLEDQTDFSAPLTVKEIEIVIMNQEALKNDSLLESQLKSLVKQEINHLIGIEITVLSASDELLISAIENKAFIIDDVTYHFTTKRLTFAPQLKILLEVKVVN